MSDIVANLDQQLGADAVDEQLTTLKLTRDDLNQLARQVLVFQDVQKKVVEQELGDDVLRAQYDKDILQYTTVQVEHILVKTEAEAQDVYQQVTAPGATDKDFQDLAKEVSTDPSAKQNGGSLGSAVASTYVPEFGEAAAALEPGEISQPVQTEFGWHVIKLVSKDVTPFEEAKAQLMQTQASTVFSDWLRTQFDEGNLEVNPKYGTVRRGDPHRGGDRQHRPQRHRERDRVDGRADTDGGLAHAVSSTPVDPGPPSADELLSHVPEGPVPSSQHGQRLLDVVRVMARLRAPDGCPWDAEQTHRTLARHLLEETHELIEAIEADDDDAMRDELGDVLLQVVFHAQLAADDGRWDVDDVAEGLVKKLDLPPSARVRRGRRHRGGRGPGELGAAQGGRGRSPRRERSRRGRAHASSAGRRGHPGVAACARTRLEGPAARGRAGVRLAHPRRCVRRPPRGGRGTRERRGPADIEDEVGDVLFATVAVARAMGVDAETALRRAVRGFAERYERFEALAAERGIDVEAADEDEVRALFRLTKEP